MHQHPSTGGFALRPLPLAVLALTLAVPLTMPLSAHAQTPSPATANQQQQYQIPAGTLEAALNALGQRAGIVLMFPSELVRGLDTAGLEGSYTPQQALNQLLSGTDLAATPQSGGSYAITAQEANGAMMLAPVRVGADALGATTENTGSYTTGSTNTATKLNLSPRETPQTVAVVTRQQMDDFAMTSVDDALTATSGVIIYNRSNAGSLYYSRGFELQSQYDGVPNPAGISQINLNPQIDNAFLDRVEVLQGPSGLLSGAGDPGGTINLVRKRPTQEFQAHVEAQGGSWNQRRVVGDISSPLVGSGRIRGRLVALMDERDSFVDHAFRDRQAAYGIIEGDLTSSTTVYASLQYQEDKRRNHIGVPFAADGSDASLDRSSFFGNANNLTTNDYTLYTLGLDQQLPADWDLKLSYTNSNSNTAQRNWSNISGALDPLTGDGMSVMQIARASNDVSYDALDAYVSGPLTLLDRHHELVLGINGSTITRKTMVSEREVMPVNVYTFGPGTLPRPVEGSISPGGWKITQQGVYGVGRFNLSDSLKLITGTRISWYENENVITGATTSKEIGMASPYAGLVYDINVIHSAYISYSDIFNPQSNKSEDGSTLKPVVGSNYEIGIKSELFGGRLNTAAALFRLEQTNLSRLDDSIPNDPGNTCGGWCYTASDKVTSEGVELSINGEIQPDWNLAAGYTYVDSEYASGADKGESYNTWLPQHTVQLSSTYRLPNTNWSIGGNLQYYSKIYREGADWKISRDVLTLIGLTVNYQITPKADLTLVANNLFDKTYRTSLESRNYSAFGEPRNMAVNLKYRF